MWGIKKKERKEKNPNSLISYSEPDLKDEKSQTLNKCFTWIKTLFLVLLCKNKRKLITLSLLEWSFVSPFQFFLLSTLWRERARGQAQFRNIYGPGEILQFPSAGRLRSSLTPRSTNEMNFFRNTALRLVPIQKWHQYKRELNRQKMVLKYLLLLVIRFPAKTAIFH